ncbi:MAG: hypothetical protein R2705_11660 [Ilumatobacteraceae bacterium]
MGPRSAFVEAPPGQPDRRRSLIADSSAGCVLRPSHVLRRRRTSQARRRWPDIDGPGDWRAPAALGAFVANVPFLFWNLRNSFACLHQQNEVPGTYLDRLSGFFTGPAAAISASWAPTGPGRRPSDGWLVWFGIPALALAGAIRLARRRTAGRMYLAAIVFCWPIMAVFAPLGQTRDGRYGVIVLPSSPCVSPQQSRRSARPSSSASTCGRWSSQAHRQRRIAPALPVRRGDDGVRAAERRGSRSSWFDSMPLGSRRSRAAIVVTGLVPDRLV